jgi:hypothetical protein
MALIFVAGAPADNTTGNFISTFLGDGSGHFSLKQKTDLGSGSSKARLLSGISMKMKFRRSLSPD